MKDEGQDIEQWVRQLARKSPSGEVASDIETLRTVIQASDQFVSASTAADQLAHARLIKRLEDEGLLSSRPRWRLVAAAAAAVLIAVIGLRIALLPIAVDRGVAGNVTLIAEQPDVTLAQVLRELRALGLQPRTVKEDGRSFIEVDVSQDHLEAFYAWAQARGGRPVTAGTYRVFVDPKAVVPR